MRRALLFVGSEERQYFSFALRVAITYLEAGTDVFSFDEAALYLQGRRIPRLQPWFGGYANLDNAGYQTVLRFRTRDTPADLLSLEDVLEGRFDPEQFAGRAVLIGAVAPSLNHLFFTPYSPRMEARFLMPGVVVHAQILSQLLDAGEGRRSLPLAPAPAGEVAWALVWALLAALAVWRAQHPLTLPVAAIGLPVALVGAAWGALLWRVWLPVVPPSLAMVASTAAVATQRYPLR